MLVVYLFLIAMFSFFIFYDYDDVLAGVDNAGVPGFFNELRGVDDSSDDSLCGNTYCDDNAGEDGISCPVDCVTQCNDLVDNDRDGDLDLDDSGCVDGNDDSESGTDNSEENSSGSQ